MKNQLIVLQNEKNLGITATLNKGLSWIEKNTDATYIARLDCGDKCDEERFSLQVQYMDAHPQTGLIGSWCQIKIMRRRLLIHIRRPPSMQRLERQCMLRNVFMHATVMFQNFVVKAGRALPDEL